MSANLVQSKSLVTGSQQSLEDVSGEGRDIMRNLVIEGEYFLVEEGSVGVLRGEEGTSKGRVPQTMA